MEANSILPGNGNGDLTSVAQWSFEQPGKKQRLGTIYENPGKCQRQSWI